MRTRVNNEPDIEGLIGTLVSEPVELLPSSHSLTVSLQGELGSCLRQVMGKRLEEILKAEPKLVVLNCAYVSLDAATLKKPDSAIVADLLKLRELCAGKGKRLLFVRCPQELKAELPKSWEKEAVYFQNLPQAFRSHEVTAFDAGPELKLFTDAVHEVFKTQFGIRLSSKPPKQLDGSDPNPFQSEIIGLIPMLSEGSNGNVALCFKADTLCALSSKIFGSTLSKDDPEVANIAAELINIVLGCAKKDLNQRGYGIGQALPQTFTALPGKAATARLLRPSWYIEFSSEVGGFGLEVTLKAAHF